jgi:two-component system, OmpR family, response regulator
VSPDGALNEELLSVSILAESEQFAEPDSPGAPRLRILIIEDEAGLREALATGLSAEGHEVHTSGDGGEGLELARSTELDVIVCDILLPTVNGFRICRDLRADGVTTPILMLTAKDGEWDIAEALEGGADDYLTKPFSYVVLRAHIRALARRGASGTGGPSVVQVGDIRLDHRSGRCVRTGTEIELSRREQALLAALLTEAGEAVAKDELLRTVWGAEYDGDPNIVEVYIGYLRRKLDTPFDRHSIETVRGFGYRWNPQV